MTKAPPDPTGLCFVVHRDTEGDWRSHYLDEDNTVLASSAGSSASQAECVRATGIMRLCSHAPVVIRS